MCFEIQNRDRKTQMRSRMQPTSWGVSKVFWDIYFLDMFKSQSTARLGDLCASREVVLECRGNKKLWQKKVSLF